MGVSHKLYIYSLFVWPCYFPRGSTALPQDFYPSASFWTNDVSDSIRATSDYNDNVHSVDLYREVFEEWKHAYGISFNSGYNTLSTRSSETSSNADELLEASRLKLFANRYDALEKWLWENEISDNKQGEKASFSVGLNHLAALDDSEIKEMLGFRPSAELEDLRTEAEANPDGRSRRLSSTGSPVQIRRATRVREDLPDHVDWRDLGVITDIKSQGRCGGCWAFTAVAALEGSLALDTGVLVSLSERELIDCDAKGKNLGCSGGNYYYAFDYSAFGTGVGLATSQDYPYTDKAGAKAAVCKKQGITGVAHSSPVVHFVDRNEHALMEAVAEQPVAVAISGYTPEFLFYAGGILNTPKCGVQVDHAVLLVGYGRTTDGEEYWIIKNSWGTGWGEAGFARLAKGDQALLEATNNLGQCGILYQANFIERGICAVQDCSLHASREFCTVDHGCINSTTTYDGTIPTRRTFIRNIGRENVADNDVMLASIITGAVAGTVLIGVVALEVRQRLHAPGSVDKVVENTADDVGQIGRFNEFRFIDELDSDDEEYLSDGSESDFDDIEAFIASDANIDKRRKGGSSRRHREKHFRDVVREFRKRTKQRHLDEATIARYLNGVDGNVKAAAHLYLKREGGTKRWL